jgi:hypothetical protein
MHNLTSQVAVIHLPRKDLGLNLLSEPTIVTPQMVLWFGPAYALPNSEEQKGLPYERLTREQLEDIKKEMLEKLQAFDVGELIPLEL